MFFAYYSPHFKKMDPDLITQIQKDIIIYYLLFKSSKSKVSSSIGKLYHNLTNNTLAYPKPM